MSLIAIIGNAVLDYDFRDELLTNPVKAAEDYGFQLTKQEYEELSRLKENLDKRNDFKSDIRELMEKLGKNVVPVCCPQRACTMRKHPYGHSSGGAKAAD